MVVLGPEMVNDEDTHWTGMKVPTGRMAVTMVGDNHIHYVEPEELTTIDREAFCGECGQTTCRHDGYERE